MSKFETNIISIYKEKGKIWLSHLPVTVQKITKLWNLEDLHPVADLSYNYVLSGWQNTQPIILKLSPDDNNLKKEARALKAFAGHGAVQILDQTDEALLLERAVPGLSLTKQFPSNDEKATKIFCQVMQKLHMAPIPQKHQFPHISDWLITLNKDRDLPNINLKKTRTLKEQLLKTASSAVLLHGDLHHYNILSNNSDWLVIDPKGVIGEPAYEVGAFIRNPISGLLHTPHAITFIENRIRLCSDLLNLDKTRITHWCFVQAVLGYIWCLKDNVDPKYFFELIKIFDQMV